MSKLSVYNGKEWIEIAKNGKDAVVDYEYILSQIPKPVDGKDGEMGVIDEATIAYLEDEVKKAKLDKEAYDRALGIVDQRTSFLINKVNNLPSSGGVADKIIAGTGISVAEGAGADENKLVITNTDKGSDVDLSGFVPYTGATGNVDLGVNRIDAANLQTATGENQDYPNVTVLETFQSGHGWVYTSGGGSMVDDTSDFVIGTQSLSITTDSAETQTRVTKSSISPTIDFTNKNIEVIAKINTVANFPTATSQLFFAVSSDNFSTYKYSSATYQIIQYEQSGDAWVKMSFSGWDYSSGSTNLAAINAMRIYFRGANTGTTTLHINRIAILDKPAKPIISFTFDDGNATDYTEAAVYMAKYGYAGTAYVIRDREALSGYLTLAQMKKLQDTLGWDISAHGETTFNNFSTQAEMEAEAIAIKSYLIRNGFINGADHLAYPGGIMNTSIVLPIIQKYFKTGRLSSAPGNETLPLATPFAFKNYPVAAATSVATVKAQIDTAITNKSYLPLTFHKLVTSGATTVQYNIADFKKIVDYVATKQQAGLVDVKTVSEVYNKYESIDLGEIINGAVEKTTPVDADSVVIVNSESANAIGRSTFTNVKAFLKTYFDTLYLTSANVSDTAYGVGWNGVTTTAPSKNAVYDEIELRAPKASPSFTGTVTLPTGDGTNSPLNFPAGTLKATPADGDIEMDANALYACTDAGNRGVIPIEHLIRADATRTFTSDTNQQAIFNSPAGGTLTLETGTYLFEGLIAMTSMSATSGNGKFSLIGAGTATLGGILWQAYGNDNTAETTGAATGGSWHVIATQTAANIATAATGTALAFLVKGTFEVTGAGTIIPSFAQTTAAAAVVSIGSYFKCNRIGTTSLTSVGQWT